MKIRLSKRFEKDALAIDDKRVREKIQQVLIQAKTVEKLASMDDLEEMTGYPNYYRIGIFCAGEEIEFLRVGRREGFYKRFP